jgi:hypothetical protein
VLNELVAVTVMGLLGLVLAAGVVAPILCYGVVFLKWIKDSKRLGRVMGSQGQMAATE